MSVHVLLVEDNALNSELISDLLTTEGHRVDLAVNGAQLRERLAAGVTPDLVLMDILLPDVDGTELLGEVRTVPRFAQVPVVAVTAHALAGDATRLLGMGFKAVITKPINTRTFVDHVVRLAGGVGSAAMGS